jgi:hypothetical protein
LEGGKGGSKIAEKVLETVWGIFKWMNGGHFRWEGFGLVEDGFNQIIDFGVMFRKLRFLDFVINPLKNLKMLFWDTELSLYSLYKDGMTCIELLSIRVFSKGNLFLKMNVK